MSRLQRIISAAVTASVFVIGTPDDANGQSAYNTKATLEQRSLNPLPETEGLVARVKSELERGEIPSERFMQIVSDYVIENRILPNGSKKEKKSFELAYASNIIRQLSLRGVYGIKDDYYTAKEQVDSEGAKKDARNYADFDRDLGIKWGEYSLKIETLDKAKNKQAVEGIMREVVEETLAKYVIGRGMTEERIKKLNHRGLRILKTSWNTAE